MLKSAQTLMSEYLDIHAQRRKVLMIFALIAFVVIVTVVSFTIFPAITMQGDDDAICGMAEHIHSEECYNKTLICETPEREEHHHGEGCYEKQLTCEEEHDHTDACYEDVLICTAEETDGHTHTDECYQFDLVCELPEHTHTSECYPEDKAKPVEGIVTDGTCFEPVRSIDEFDDASNVYIIVSPDGNKAVTLGESAATSEVINIAPLLAEKTKLYDIKNNHGERICKSGVNDALKWSIIAGDNKATIRNALDGRFYINLDGKNVAENNSSTLTFKYDKKSDLWTITQKVDGAIRYLSYSHEGIVNTIDGDVGNHYWQIFKLKNKKVNYNSASYAVSIAKKTPNTVIQLASSKKDSKKNTNKMTETVEQFAYYGLNAGAVEEDYIEPSDKKEGSYTSQSGGIWNYASDPATSQLESQYDGVTEDDGKVLVDKSVIYGDDDYGAFQDYAEGTFGVELSVLAQQYNILRKETIEAPVDVMFVIDTSGSMMGKVKSDDGSFTARFEALANALNDTIDTVIKANPENRIGITHFSDGGEVMVPLDYYNAKANADYFTSSWVFKGWDHNPPQLGKLDVNITNRNGVTINDSTSDEMAEPDWHGTYTQMGIALANEEFQNADTTYVSQNGTVLPRKPVIILITDGDPTISTYNYTDVLNGPNYGDTLSHGAHGYYTILSALYYKQQIAEHYHTDANFSTIGIGVVPGDYSQFDGPGNMCSHNYVTAVLNPTEENLAKAVEPGNYTDPNHPTGDELQQLLNNEYPEDFIDVGYTAKYPTSSELPVIANPYTDYSYVDNAYFGDMTEEELKEALKNAFETIIERVEYGFNLREATAAVLTDPIGYGMELKSDPVLRYNGDMYTFTNKTVRAGTNGSTITKYVYAYTATDEDIVDYEGNVRQVDLSHIIVEVETDRDGNQTVSMSVPEDAMPVYSPDLETRVYTPELPVRLIYQVGLTETAIQNANAGDVFYTNRWENGEKASAKMYPSDANPYYENGVGPYQDNTTAKTDNPTETNGNSSKYTSQNDQTVINTALGNNGKLVFVSSNENIKLDVVKKWQDADGDNITNTAGFNDVTVKLYRRLDAPGSASELVATVMLGNANDWKHRWNDLPYFNNNGDRYIYYVEENNIEDYTANITQVTEGGVEKVTIVNKANPTDHAVQAKKVWLDYDGEEIEDTSFMPQINVELWRHVNVQEQQAGESATVTIMCDTTVLGTYQVAKGTNISYAIGATYGSATNAGYAVIRMDGTNVTSIRDNNRRTYRYTDLQAVTVNSDMTITYTSSFAVNQWSFHTQPAYTAPSTATVNRQGPDERVGQATLNEDNYWKHLWADLPDTETKANGSVYTYSYYVKEIGEIPGYTTSYSQNNNNGITEGRIIITNQSKTPKASVKVVKVWKNYFDNVIENTNLLPQVEVELWRHVSIRGQSAPSVTVTIMGDTTVLGTYQVAKGSNITYAIGATYGSATNAGYAAIRMDGTNVTSTRDNNRRTYRYTDMQTITADSDMTVTYTSTQAGAQWSFHSPPIYTAAGGAGEVHQGADELVGTATLKNSNDWQHVFKNLDTSETIGTDEYIYTYFVKEISEINGYTTSYSEGNEDGIQGGEIVITNKANTAMEALPETGGAGSGSYIMGGMAVMLASIVMLSLGVFVTQRKRVMGIIHLNENPEQ